MEKSLDSEYKPGLVVKILDGPFKGFLGKIEDVEESANQASVLVYFFGKYRKATFTFSNIDIQYGLILP